MSNTSLPLVHVVVLNYNGMRFLKDCFESLEKTTYQNMEVVLLDNCSTDESTDYIKKKFPKTRILQTGINGGYSLAYNLAFKQCSGKYMVMLNNEVIVRSNWLEPMVQEAESDALIAAVAPKLIYMQDRSMFEYAGACGGFIDKYGYPFAKGRVFYTIEKDAGQYDEISQIFWVTGAAMFVRLSAIKECGNLDVDFVHHMEEIDLCWRLNLAGFKLKIVPESVVEHYGGATIIPDSYRKTYWNHRNSIFMLFKNLERKNLFPLIFKHYILDQLAAVWYALKLQPHRLFAVQSAHFWILMHARMILRKRREAQLKRKVSDDQVFELIYPRSIALRYFVFGEKTFQQLLKSYPMPFHRNQQKSFIQD